jgi:CO/xanthine dehydrogenase FAD-binding subunit
MNKTIREYHRPKDIETAVKLLQRKDLPTKLLWVSPRPSNITIPEVEAVVDLGQIGLDHINETEDGRIHIGTMTTLQSVATSPILRSYANDILSKAAARTAHYGLRNLATIGGLLSMPKSGSEILLALLVLNAVIVFHDAIEQREESLVDFLDSIELRSRAMLPLEVHFERKSSRNFGASLTRVARSPMDTPILAVAAALELYQGSVRSIGVAVGGVDMLPQRLTKIENTLIGTELSDERLKKETEGLGSEILTFSDFRASAAYRRAMTITLTRRAIDLARKNVTGDAV